MQSCSLLIIEVVVDSCGINRLQVHYFSLGQVSGLVENQSAITGLSLQRVQRETGSHTRHGLPCLRAQGISQSGFREAVPCGRPSKRRASWCCATDQVHTLHALSKSSPELSVTLYALHRGS